MNNRNLVSVSFFIILTLFSCKKPVPIETDLNGRSTIIINEAKRTFYLKEPKDYNPRNKYPLIIYLHAAGETAFNVLNIGFTEEAHKNGYIILYPTGLGGNWKLYNDMGNENSDVNFINTLIDVLSKEYNIDQKRIYASGRSLGGFMSYQLAFQLPKKISAISILSGSVFPEKIPHNQKPLSIQHIHALNDNMIYYNSPSDQVFPIPDLINFWIDKNQTERTGKVLYNQDGIVRTRYTSEKTNCSVELVTHNLGGHGNLPMSPNFVIDFFNRAYLP